MIKRFLKGGSNNGRVTVTKAARCVVESLEQRQLLSGVVTTFPITPADPNTWANYTGHIVAGSDGKHWFTDEGNNAIGKVTPTGIVTEYKLPVHNVDDGSGTSSPDDPTPDSIVLGPDGNLWFTEVGVDRIGRITPGGAITEFTTPTGNSNPNSLIVGPDGNLWFGEYGANKIGRITTSGKITEFSLGNYSIPSDNAMTVGPDGKIDFVGFDDNEDAVLGAITTAGKATYQSLADLPGSIVTFDGAIWSADNESVDRIAADGTITRYKLPDTNYNSVDQLIVGSDGNLYATLFGSNAFAKITSTGDISEYSLPTDTAGNTVTIYNLTQASDGRFWYLDTSTPEIGVVDLTNALLISQTNSSVTADASQTTVVASFVDLSGPSVASDYTASITLSDGSTIDGSISRNSTGGFDVSATSTWPVGDNRVTVIVADTRNTSRIATKTDSVFAAVPTAAGVGVNVTAIAGQTFNGIVATFTNIDFASLSSYSAVISWGDGHGSAGTITANNSGGINVSGSNDYAQSGNYTISVSLFPFQTDVNPGGPIVGPINPMPVVAAQDAGTVNSSDAGSTGGGSGSAGGTSIPSVPSWYGSGGPFYTTSGATVSVGVMQGTGYSVQASSKSTFNGDVASFALATPTADLSHYHASVEYNDPGMNDWFFKLSNIPTAGVITADGTGSFTVSTTANFASSGLFHFVVKITDDRLGTGDAATIGVAYGQLIVDSPAIWLPVYYAGTVSKSGSASATVGSGAAAPNPSNPAFGEHVQATPTNVTAVAGKTFNGNTASLKGLAAGTSLSSLHGTVNWGDGTTSPATFVAGKNGTITIKGSHRYTLGGKQAVSIDITQSLNTGTGSSLYPLHLPKIESTAHVAGGKRASVITQGGIAIAATAGAAFTANLAAFDATSIAGVTRTAQISWGDGTHSVGTITNDGTVVTVSGTHTYRKAGKYKPLVEVLQTATKRSQVKVARVLALVQGSALVTA